MEEWKKKRERKREQGADTDLTIRGNPTNRMTGMKGRLICIFSLSLSLFPWGGKIGRAAAAAAAAAGGTLPIKQDARDVA